MGAKTKIDWEEAKLSYIKDRKMTLKQVAEDFDASYAYVRQVAAKDNWASIKEKHWRDAEEEALKEAEDTTKNLLIRHSKVSRYLYSGGLRELRKRLQEMELNPDAEPIDDRTLVYMIKEGLRAERELYPKKLQVEGDVGIEAEGVSEELKDAIYKEFRDKIIGGGSGSASGDEEADKD